MSLISINDFAKTTYGTLKLEQRNLFREMMLNGILNSQTKITGKGEFQLFKRMKKILGV